MAIRIAYLTSKGQIIIHPVKDWGTNAATVAEADRLIDELNNASLGLAMAQRVNDWREEDDGSNASICA